MGKRKTIFSITIGAFAALFGISALAVPNIAHNASANSAMRVFSGSTATGLIVTDEECPITVEHEDLFFDLPCTDANTIYNALGKGDGEYGNYVRAAYTFRNPADYDVHATLAFPFGNVPLYLDPADYDDTELYDITLNGAVVDRTLRHTYIGDTYYYEYDYDKDRDLARIRDEYVKNEIFNDELVIYKHECVVSLDTFTDDDIILSLQDTVFTSDGRDAFYRYGSSSKAALAVTKGVTFTIYTFGADTEDIASRAKLFSEDRDKNYNNIPVLGTFKVKSTELADADDLIYKDYNENGAVSRIDWHNAIQDKITSFCEGSITDRGYLSHWLFTLEARELMRWYEYDIDIAAGESIVNTVTAPVYPDINDEFSPAMFTYRYLLTPAEGWADFDSLTITVKTPHYLVGTSLGDFEQIADDTYRLNVDGLPKGELTLLTCASPEPTHHNPSSKLWTGISIVFIIAFIGFLAVIVTVIIVVVLVTRQSKPPTNKQ